MKPVLTPRAPWFASLAPALFAACLLSCEQPPPPLTEYPQGTARGTVFEDRNGNGVQDEGEPGIPGVGVSDQRLVTVTNSQGRWSLPRHDKAVYFVIKPRGYRTPLSGDNLPLFYYLHNETQPLELEGPTIPTTGPLPSSLDFPLVRQQEPERFQALFLGDPQPRDQTEVQYLAHDVLEEMVGTDAAFAVTLGDISFDDKELYPSLIQAMGRVGIPFYNTHGNHDANYDGKDTYDHYESWRTFFGPRYYSFDYGPVHFVILSDVLFPEGGTSYVAGLGEDQLAWLEADLSHVPLEQLVVLSMHIPPGGSSLPPDFGRLETLLLDRPNVLSFSAHTHTISVGYLTEEAGWSGANPHFHINAGATCGRWWGGTPDETEIPHSTSADGSPNGYFVLTFDGNRFVPRFKAARRPAEYQMQIHAPDQVARDSLANTPVLVNVFAGSQESVVEMRVGEEGAWAPLDHSPQADPLYARVMEREVGGRPSVAFHMWEGRLPTGLSRGGHLIRIRTRDVFGQEFTGSRIIWVRGERP